MLRIDRTSRTFQPLDQCLLPERGIRERSDLQQMIKTTPDPFFRELGERLLLVGEELRPAEFVDDRIDLLAVDETGGAVIIELKRGGHKLQLLQAVAYAGMVAKWDSARFIAERSRLTGQAQDATEEEFEEFVGGDVAVVNHSQRIILIAESFDYEVLVAAEWLNEGFNVDVRCARLSLSSDGANDFLTCSVIFPPPEITEHAVRRGTSRRATPSRWGGWDEALADCDNAALVACFKGQLANGVRNNLSRRLITVAVGGRGWFNVQARKSRAYVWQSGRFHDDLAFWKARLSPQADVTEVADKRRVRFYLVSETDFRRFEEACKTDLLNVSLRRADVHPDGDEEADADGDEAGGTP
jgi:hypothetical protein